MSAEQGIPLTWPEVLERDCGELEENLEKDIPEIAEKLQGEDRSLYFEPLASNLARLIVCAGVERCRPALRLVRDRLKPALADFENGIDDENVDDAKGIVDFVHLLRCSGETIPKPLADCEESWLPQIADLAKELRDNRRTTMALAALATGQTKLVPAFIGGGKLPKTFKPGQTFEFDTPGVVRYLAVAIEHGAHIDDVGPAWEELVNVFPRKRATNALGWIDLFWAARAYWIHFEEGEVKDVAQDLYEYVRT